MQYIPRYPIELGVQLGTTQFLGDLGGTRGAGSGFITDTDFLSTRVAVGIFGRYNMGGHFSFRLDASYLSLFGDDKFAGNGHNGFSATRFSYDEGWFRHYRNLHVLTHVLEVTNSCQVIPYNFKLTGSRYTNAKQNVLSPYIVFGIGFILFHPQASYHNQWIDLKPLSTEGQGLVDGIDYYSSVQLVVPTGFGLQWEHDHRWLLSFEVTHRTTFTDYLDDISTEYVDPAIFRKHFDPEKAALATALARRSHEQDPNNYYGHLTAPGQQRGDPKDNDAYYTITLRLSFYLLKSRPWACVKDY